MRWISFIRLNIIIPSHYCEPTLCVNDRIKNVFGQKFGSHDIHMVECGSMAHHRCN